MPRLIEFFRPTHFSDDPVVTLFHYACGRMADWANGSDGRVMWTARTHRGVQWLDKVEFPRKQKRYIFSPQFEIRYNTAFEEVIRACAESGMQKENKTWIVEGYIRGMINLNKLGFAHSYEAWTDGKLVGGSFGVQLGSLITVDSMFYRTSNASKAAYGQTLVRLRERGFKLMDTNGVSKHQVNYGEEWMPQWQFEKVLADCLLETPSLTDAHPCQKLPASIRALLPMVSLGKKLGRRLGFSKAPSAGVTGPSQGSEKMVESGVQAKADKDTSVAEGAVKRAGVDAMEGSEGNEAGKPASSAPSTSAA